MSIGNKDNRDVLADLAGEAAQALSEYALQLRKSQSAERKYSGISEAARAEVVNSELAEVATENIAKLLELVMRVHVEPKAVKVDDRRDIVDAATEAPVIMREQLKGVNLPK